MKIKTYKKLWGTMKKIFRGKFVVLGIYIF